MLQVDPQSNIVMIIIFALIIACCTAYYANRKGRNPIIWFILGILLGIIAPLILLFLPTVNGGRNVEKPTMSVSNPDPLLRQQPPLPPPSPAELKHQEEEEKLWYYLDQQHQQMGPVSIVALRELWNTGRLNLNSYVWTNGMSQWEKVDQLSELKVALNKL